MAEFVDRAVVIETIRDEVRRQMYGLGLHKIHVVDMCFVVDAVRKIPTADVVQVVHCKDCVYMEPGVKDSNEVWCCWHDSRMMEDDFCSRGKEKEHERTD